MQIYRLEIGFVLKKQAKCRVSLRSAHVAQKHHRCWIRRPVIPARHRFLSCRNAAAGVFGKDSTFHLHRLLHTPIGGKQLGYDCTSGHGPVDQSDLDFADA